jgi:c-di-GMP-binding flagellar brake protein YcgR
MDEHRQLPRWEVNKDIQVWIPMTQGFGQGRVEDLHLKGMRISFAKRLPHQKAIKMAFALEANYDFIKVEAQIPWRKEDAPEKYVYGLSFTRIDDEAKKKISKYIDANCGNQFKKNSLVA